MSLLVATGLEVSLGTRTVLRGVDLALQAGEMAAILGPNGAGKTTLLQALAGLQPLNRGQVRLAGHDSAGLTPSARARLVGYLPQGATVAWSLSAARVIALGRHPHRTSWRRATVADAAAIAAAMALTDVTDIATRPLEELSGGERMRVHIARLLAGEHRLILADEPTASLDPRYQLQVLATLRRIAGSGIGVIIVMHDLALAARYCDRLIVLADGSVAADAVPARALNDELLQTVFRVRAVRAQSAAGDSLLSLAPLEDG